MVGGVLWHGNNDYFEFKVKLVNKIIVIYIDQEIENLFGIIHRL